MKFPPFLYLTTKCYYTYNQHKKHLQMTHKPHLLLLCFSWLSRLNDFNFWSNFFSFICLNWSKNEPSFEKTLKVADFFDSCTLKEKNVQQHFPTTTTTKLHKLFFLFDRSCCAIIRFVGVCRCGYTFLFLLHFRLNLLLFLFDNLLLVGHLCKSVVAGDFHLEGFDGGFSGHRVLILNNYVDVSYTN